MDNAQSSIFNFPDYPRRNACGNCPCRNILGNKGTTAYHCPFTDMHARQYGHVKPYIASFS